MFRNLAITAIVLLNLVGCSATATLARKDPHGGRVALHGPYMPAMSEARLLMVEHCEGRFQMQEHGDIVVFRCGDTLRSDQEIAQLEAGSDL